MLNTLKFLALATLVVLVGCSGGGNGDAAQETASDTSSDKAEPEFVTVQHILIGFSGSVPGKPIQRTQEDAAKLAEEVFAMAKKGDDFDALVKKYTDDAFPGKYEMANFNVEVPAGAQIFPRGRMVAAFGDVGFPLEVGEIGMATFDPQKSQFGWHIIKRVK